MLVTFLSSENIYFTFTFPNWNFPWCSSNAFQWVSKKKKKKGNYTNIQEWIPFFFLFLTPTLPAPLKASLLWAHVAFHLTFLWSLALGIQFAIRRSPAYIYLIVIHHSVQKKKSWLYSFSKSDSVTCTIRDPSSLCACSHWNYTHSA